MAHDGKKSLAVNFKVNHLICTPFKLFVDLLLSFTVYKSKAEQSSSQIAFLPHTNTISIHIQQNVEDNRNARSNRGFSIGSSTILCTIPWPPSQRRGWIRSRSCIRSTRLRRISAARILPRRLSSAKSLPRRIRTTGISAGRIRSAGGVSTRRIRSAGGISTRRICTTCGISTGRICSARCLGSCNWFRR